MVVGRIIGGVYVRVGDDATPTGSKGALYGDGSRDYFRGVRPSMLKELDNRQLHSAAKRLYTTLSEQRGTTEELANATDAYDATIREARGRRATLHE
jgi:hypothetical protein